MKVVLSAHAAARLAQRGITVDQVQDCIRRHLGPPLPGDGGNLVFLAMMEGKALKVVTAADRTTIVTAMWSTP